MFEGKEEWEGERRKLKKDAEEECDRRIELAATFSKRALQAWKEEEKKLVLAEEKGYERGFSAGILSMRQASRELIGSMPRNVQEEREVAS